MSAIWRLAFSTLAAEKKPAPSFTRGVTASAEDPIHSPMSAGRQIHRAASRALVAKTGSACTLLIMGCLEVGLLLDRVISRAADPCERTVGESGLKPSSERGMDCTDIIRSGLKAELSRKRGRQPAGSKFQFQRRREGPPALARQAQTGFRGHRRKMPKNLAWLHVQLR